MLGNLTDYSFLGMNILALFLAFFAKDWRLRIGVFTFVAIWSYGQVTTYFVRIPVLYLPSEILVNFVVFYVFIQLHFRREEEEREPLWPLAVMLLELVILCTHITYLIYGFKIYSPLVNILFAGEYLIMYYIACVRIISKYKSPPP